MNDKEEKTCGTCVNSGVVDQGDMCPCRKDGKYRKFYDKACEEWKGGKQ